MADQTLDQLPWADPLDGAETLYLVQGGSDRRVSARDLALAGAYRHVQNVAAAQWTITHNLGRVPAVTVTDSAGSVVTGDVQHLSDTQCLANFSAPFAGEAHCN